jgi:hypothetical protein
MAEGADQIAAEVGLEIEGVRVVALLPLAREEYEQDFETKDQLTRFRTLLDNSFEVLLAPDFYDQTAHADLSQDFDNPRALRDHAYRDCARLISQQSHLLIAVWDGEPSTLVGGTSDTISHRLSTSKQIPIKGEMERFWPQEDGILLHIRAQRSDEAAASNLAPMRVAPNEIILLRQNLEPQIWITSKEDEVLRNFELINSLLLERSDPSHKFPQLTALLMEIADKEASKLQNSFKRHSLTLLSLGILVLFLTDLQHVFTPVYLFFATLFFFLATALVWSRFLKGKLMDSFYQFRALAEGLRVQAVWMDCGISEDVSNEFLRGTPDVSWIPRAIRTARFLDSVQLELSKVNRDLSEEAITATANRWLHEQITYFGGSVQRKGAVKEAREKRQFFAKVSLISLSIAFICLVLDCLKFLPHSGPLSESAIRIEQIVLHLSLSISAASAAYNQLMAFREIERQYAIGLNYFQQGQLILEKEESLHKSKKAYVQSVVTHIGRQALQETGTWLALKRDRAVNPI